jgi:hypothetical protein
LYTEDEKTGNARILNLVFSPFGGMLMTEYVSSLQKVVLLSLCWGHAVV